MPKREKKIKAKGFDNKTLLLACVTVDVFGLGRKSAACVYIGGESDKSLKVHRGPQPVSR